MRFIDINIVGFWICTFPTVTLLGVRLCCSSIGIDVGRLLTRAGREAGHVKVSLYPLSITRHPITTCVNVLKIFSNILDFILIVFFGHNIIHDSKVVISKTYILGKNTLCNQNIHSCMCSVIVYNKNEMNMHVRFIILLHNLMKGE